MKLAIKDTFNVELPADPVFANTRRQVHEACFSWVKPKSTSKPELVHVSPEMLKSIGLTQEDAKQDAFLKTFTGNKVLPSTKPYAMCYGGHQFGNWAGQLGDGRAINLFEVEHKHKKWALQLKGAGETPYSRTADGLAVLRSSIREYLCSEAMYHLGVPTTRALSLALTGDQVLRDILYDGNPAYEPGAIVCRVATSFIRFGSFEILAARKDITNLKRLVDYTIKYHFNQLDSSKEGYLQFFKEVAQRSLDMVIHWQRVGFVHGVMNTDNMSILGLTIDYGPYGWLDNYDPEWTPNTTDSQYKRYKFGTQPDIVLWNLYQLANALYPLIEDSDGLNMALTAYQSDFISKHLEMMRSKIGLIKKHSDDAVLVYDLEELLTLTETDMTLFYRSLGKYIRGNSTVGIELIRDAFYVPNKITTDIELKWNEWFKKYDNRLLKEDLTDIARQQKMNSVNPKYVLRNYMAQLAIEAAEKKDYSIIDELYKMLQNPYKEQPKYERWFSKRPDWARHKVGCSMLSCSS